MTQDKVSESALGRLKWPLNPSRPQAVARVLRSERRPACSDDPRTVRQLVGQNLEKVILGTPPSDDHDVSGLSEICPQRIDMGFRAYEARLRRGRDCERRQLKIALHGGLGRRMTSALHHYGSFPDHRCSANQVIVTRRVLPDVSRKC